VNEASKYGLEPTNPSQYEKQSIVEALSCANGNKSRAAQMLGLTRFQLYTRLRRFGLAD
jgi:transcriptional regulator with GAF, ATPase, and Fis domain